MMQRPCRDPPTLQCFDRKPNLQTTTQLQLHIFISHAVTTIMCIFVSQEKEELLQQNAELRVKLESKVCVAVMLLLLL